MLQVNPDTTSHDTRFPLHDVGSVISQQFDLIFTFPFF